MRRRKRASRTDCGLGERSENRAKAGGGSELELFSGKGMRLSETDRLIEQVRVQENKATDRL